MCEYLSKGVCCLTLKYCRKTTGQAKCKLKSEVKEKTISEEIYHINKDVTCKTCGCHFAYQCAGKLYPQGLPKEKIMKYKEVFGKYYNKCYFSAPVGFGGTIPWICGNCGKIGVIGEGEIGLEGYPVQFKLL